MIWLALGIALWAATHFVPTIGRLMRQRLVDDIGLNPYKGLFSLAILGAVALMVVGWRAADPVPVYAPPEWSRPVAGVLIIGAFMLLVAARHPTRLKRLIRHPQLTGIAVWAAAHLLANGDSRSLVLFGGLGLWALVEMPLINRRDGLWIKQAVPSVAVELRGLVIAAAAFAVILFLHPYFTGVSLISR